MSVEYVIVPVEKKSLAHNGQLYENVMVLNGNKI